MKRVVTVEEDTGIVDMVKTVWSEEEANEFLVKGWILLHGGVAHRGAGGFQAKPVFVVGRKKSVEKSEK